MQRRVSVIYCLAGVQGGARSQLAASGSVSPRQWRPEHGDRGRPTPRLSTLLGYVTNSVSVFSMFMATHSHYSLLLFSVANCGQLCCVLRCCPWVFFLFLLSDFPSFSHKQTNQSLGSDVTGPTGQHRNIILQSRDMFWLVGISWHWILTRILKHMHLCIDTTREQYYVAKVKQ